MHHLEHSFDGIEWRAMHDHNEPFKDPKRAKRRAVKLSRTGFGLVRVVDTRGRVLGTYQDGEEIAS